jgi:integrase
MEKSAMPRLVRKPPAYQHHKGTGQARVRIGGRDYWLGTYGSDASHREYERLIAEWRTRAPVAQATAPPPRLPAQQSSLTVAELILAYWRHAQSYYVKDGKPTGEVENIRYALKPVRALYGHTMAREFGPLALKATRQAMIDKGASRGYINQQVGRVRAMFRWAVENEMLEPGIYQALRAVAGLKRGRSAARETPRVKPVADAVVEKTLAYLAPMVAVIVRVQRLAGMRPHEVLEMRGADIDRSDPACWVYQPARHKTALHNRERLIFIGPRAQAILAPYLMTVGDGYLFSPARSEERRDAERRAARKTPRWPSHCKRTRKARPKRSPGEHYTHDSYRRAIARACELAFPHPTLSAIPAKERTPEQIAEIKAWNRKHVWHPHMLRHTAATEVRKRFGLEASQAVLGHAELGVTQVYAERDMTKAREVMSEVG